MNRPQFISRAPHKLLFSLFLLASFSLPGISPALAQDNSKLLMQIVPDQVKAGELFTVIMQFKNEGSTTWSTSSGYHLSSRNKHKWNLKRVEIEEGKRIAPGDTATFKFQVAAPLDSGFHDFEWQMRKGGSWFGRASNEVKINVAGYKAVPNDAEFVYQNVPVEMVANNAYTTVLHFKNIGHTSWMPGRYRLEPANPEDALNWATDMVDIKNIVRPGEFYTFRFNIQAPSEAGSYDFQWQITHESAGAFGDTSEILNIRVMEGM